MRKVPKGKLATINQIRAALAKKHEATICCPMTAGISSLGDLNTAPISLVVREESPSAP